MYRVSPSYILTRNSFNFEMLVLNVLSFNTVKGQPLIHQKKVSHSFKKGRKGGGVLVLGEWWWVGREEDVGLGF